MGKIYGSIEENMTLRKFKVYVTNMYEPHLPEYFKKFNIPPFCPEDPGLSITQMSIKYILDAFIKKKDLSIPDFEDISTIIGILEQYIDSVDELNGQISPELKQYRDKCNQLMTALKIEQHNMFNYLRNRDPEKYNNRKINSVETVHEHLKNLAQGKKPLLKTDHIPRNRK